MTISGSSKGKQEAAQDPWVLYMKLCLRMDEVPTRSIRIKGKAGTSDIIVRVCYGPPIQENRANEALYGHLGAASHSEVLVHMGTSTTPESVRVTTQEGTDNPGGSWNVLITEAPMRKGAMLDLVLSSKEWLVGNMKFKGYLD
ncbi:dtw domain-containing protein 2 [Willisornis vidua]|uniref:Dtw domain-containing protein 2 n=1 Tax=Willisornis vidua TaxID=1566151 RepID=A0ABQ9D7Z7_9PASS|nr:dtw domain-containing protein 2 [Willisornis vidua]